MNEQNLIPGKHKLTVDEQSKAGKKSAEVRRRNADLRKLCKQVATMPAPAKTKLLMDSLGIPEQDQTILMGIAAVTGVLAAEGDKDARRDFAAYIGQDPDGQRRDEELKLKKKEAARKNPESNSEPTVFEQMVREIYERPNGEAEEISA